MMKKKRRGRVLLAAVILMLLASCRITDVSEGERKELSYAIVKPGDFPPEIDQILRRKKESAFQMAYESGDDLYILRGYGKQKSGGFSIQIEEVSKSENAVFVRTKLVGPAAKEEQKGAASCPYSSEMLLEEKSIAMYPFPEEFSYIYWIRSFIASYCSSSFAFASSRSA